MINIGIIGCGRILAAHLRGYRLLREAGFQDFRITALCARREEDARSYLRRGTPQRKAVSVIPGDPLAVADEYLSDFQDPDGVRVYTDYREMIAQAPVDAINDYTPHGLHHLVADRAFAHRKHLLTQKPLGVTVEAARRMCEQAAAAGVTFGVFENARYRADIQHACWALSLDGTGPAGVPQLAMLGNVGTWWAPDLVVAQTPWRHQKLLGGGLAIDLGVHQFHMIRQIGGEVKEVQATTSVVEPRRRILAPDGTVVETVDCDADDTFFASFTANAGVTGTLFASFAGHGTKTVLGNGPVFYGSKGRVSGDQLHLDGHSDPLSLQNLFSTTATPAQTAAAFPHRLKDPFAITQHFWLQAIRDGTQPPLDGQEGLRDLACAYAILESHTAGRRVSVKDVLSGDLATYQTPINRHFRIS